jgi:hypothetical protein
MARKPSRPPRSSRELGLSARQNSRIVRVPSKVHNYDTLCEHTHFTKLAGPPAAGLLRVLFRIGLIQAAHLVQQIVAKKRSHTPVDTENKIAVI